MGWQTTLDENGRVLTYSFDPIGGYSDPDWMNWRTGTTTSLDTFFDEIIPDWESVLTSALTDWGATANITFVQVEDSRSNIGAAGAQGDIRFSAHDMPSDVLGHSFYPMATGQTETSIGLSHYGDVHFSTTIDWDNYDLLETATHELGHSLGLGHNLDPDSIMFPYAGSGIAQRVAAHDQADIRALYFPVNADAPVFTGDTVTGHRNWLAIVDGISDVYRQIKILGHIDTYNEQQTAIKGVGASLSIENYAFDWTNLTLAVEGQITTRGDNAYGLAAGDFNTLRVDGTIETFGMSSDGIAAFGQDNQIFTGADSRITTHGKAASGLFLGGDPIAQGSTAVLDGQVLTHGTGGAGVFIDAQRTDLYLNGSITTRGDYGPGVCNLDRLLSTVEMGKGSVIETSGKSAHGVFMAGAGSVVRAHGQISTSGNRASGVDVRGIFGFIFLVNTGKVSTSGWGSPGIRSAFGGNIILHSGAIETTGANSPGLLISDSGDLVAVSGDISSYQDDAIRIGPSTPDGSADGDNNALAIHGSPKIAGDMRNNGKDNGVHITFGQSFDFEVSDTDGSRGLKYSEYKVPGTDFIYSGNITGNLWTGEVVAGTTRLNGDLANFSLLTIAPGAVLGGATHYSGDLVNNGILAPGNPTGTISIGGDYTQGASGILDISLGMDGSGNARYSKLRVAGTTTLAGNSGLYLDVSAFDSSLVGRPLNSIIQSSAITGADTLDVTDSSYLLDFSASLSSGNTSLDLTAARNGTILDAARRSGMAGVAGAAGALDSISGSSDTQVAAFMANLYAQETSKGVAGQITQTLPVTATQTPALAGRVVDAMAAIVQARQGSLAGLHSGDPVFSVKNVWAKPFGMTMDQKDNNGVSGFSSEAYGIGMGTDGKLESGSRLGLALFCTKARAATNHALQSSDMDVITLMAYGDRALFSDVALFWQVGGGIQDTASSRYISGIGRTAEADFTARNLFAQTRAVQAFTLSTDLTLTGGAGISYTLVTTPSYDESGAGGMNLRLDDTTNQSLVAGLEGGLSWALAQGLDFSASASLGYELIDNDMAVTSRFQAGGPSFSTQGIDNSPVVFTADVGIARQFTNRFSLDTRYDMEGRGSDFLSHMVSCKFNWTF